MDQIFLSWIPQSIQDVTCLRANDDDQRHEDLGQNIIHTVKANYLC